MDICTYLIKGIGRHADSLGNRESFKSPGIQWCSVGSGIEHAEGITFFGEELEKSIIKIILCIQQVLKAAARTKASKSGSTYRRQRKWMTPITGSRVQLLVFV